MALEATMQALVEQMQRSGQTAALAPRFMGTSMQLCVKSAHSALLDPTTTLLEKKSAAKILGKSLRGFRGFIDALDKNVPNIDVDLRAVLTTNTKFINNTTDVGLQRLIAACGNIDDLLNDMEGGSDQLVELTTDLQTFMDPGLRFRTPPRYRVRLDRAADQLRRATAEAVSKTAECTQLEDTVSRCDSEIRRLNADIAQLRNVLAASAPNVANLPVAPQQPPQSRCSCTTEVAELEEVLKETEARMVAARVACVELETEVKEAHERIATYEEHFQRQAVEVTELVDREAALKVEVAALQSASDSLLVGLGQVQQERDDALAKLRTLEQNAGSAGANQNQGIGGLGQQRQKHSLSDLERIAHLCSQAVRDHSSLFSAVEQARKMELDLGKAANQILILEARVNATRDPTKLAQLKVELAERKQRREQRSVEYKKEEQSLIDALTRRLRTADMAETAAREAGSTTVGVLPVAGPSRTRKRSSSVGSSDGETERKVLRGGGGGPGPYPGKDKPKDAKDSDRDLANQIVPVQNILSQMKVDRRDEIDVELSDRDQNNNDDDEQDDNATPSQLIKDSGSGSQSRIDDAAEDSFDNGQQSVRERRRPTTTSAQNDATKMKANAPSTTTQTTDAQKPTTASGAAPRRPKSGLSDDRDDELLLEKLFEDDEEEGKKSNRKAPETDMAPTLLRHPSLDLRVLHFTVLPVCCRSKRAPDKLYRGVVSY